MPRTLRAVGLSRQVRRTQPEASQGVGGEDEGSRASMIRVKVS